MKDYSPSVFGCIFTTGLPKLYDINFRDIKENCCLHDAILGEDTIKKFKTINVIVHEGPYGCARSRLPYILDNRFTDGVRFSVLSAGRP
jgi:hypothetical protein